MLFDRDLGFSWEHMGEQDFLAFVSSPTPSRNPPKVLVGPKSHGEYLYRYIIQQKAPHLKVETIESPYGIISCDHYQEKIWEKLCQVYLVQDPPELYDFFAESVDHDLIVIQNIQNAMQLDWLKGLLDIFYKKSRSPSHVSFLFFVQTQFDGDAYIDMSRSRPHLFQNLAVSKDTMREEYNLWRLAWETAGCRSTMHMMLSSQR